MRLERDTTEYPLQGYHVQEEVDYEHHEGVIYMRFLDFGGQRSRFKVHLDWADVERVIEKFASIGNFDAKRLLKARQITDAVKDYVSLTSNSN